jgi:hypothetical protein
MSANIAGNIDDLVKQGISVGEVAIKSDQQSGRRGGNKFPYTAEIFKTSATTVSVCITYPGPIGRGYKDKYARRGSQTQNG